MKRQELPALTSLRFPAAFAIVLFHFLAEARNVPAWIFHNLSEGVSFFYVLSGFILCYNYPSLTNRESFWVARFARIWPVHFVTLLLVLLVLPFFHILGHASWPITLPLNFLLLQSWLPWKGSMLSFNGVSWSLCVEAYFYFCFPWLLILFQRWGGTLVLTACFLQGLIVSAVGQFMFAWPQEFTSFFPACRLFEFALGMQACRIWQSRDPNRAVSPLHEILSMLAGFVFVLGVAAFVMKAADSLPLVPWFVTTTSALFFAWIIWAFAHHAGPISRLISGPLAVQLGQVSFSLYMIHQIVQRFFQAYGFDAEIPQTVYFAVYLLLSMAGAYLLFFAVENPARHWIIGAYRRAVAKRSPHSGQVNPASSSPN